MFHTAYYLLVFQYVSFLQAGQFNVSHLNVSSGTKQRRVLSCSAFTSMIYIRGTYEGWYSVSYSLSF